ncbi:transcriptional repressor LexA [Leptospira sp. GIMC2001]|uniref:transcriptional repressor LexA n=1 Tax=Leptospira sp. GIMC2001 TaxID=1513297 RepID=UPI00234AE603|nr:transcriptional repressor LexA [Leptospira sp. GIMC2001]WCL48179.1 transcriptional repressor LexA [Leptospira sp. GIMC2001]
MKDLTDKQELVYKFILNSMKERGMPPTIREIGDKFEITAKGAYDHLKAIEKKGFIKTQKNQSRAIELTRNDALESLPAQVMTIPVLGRVAAGMPILAEENVEGYIPIPDRLAKKPGTFALRVVGDSMIEAGINDGDLAIIQKKETARNGEIVVALVEDEATLKVFYKESDHIRLEPRNAKLKPIKSKKAQVMGKLIGIYRFY